MDKELTRLPMGKGELLREGRDALIVAAGSPVTAALGAADRLARDGIQAAVINARFIKPLDKELITEWVRKTPLLVTVEENSLQGGFGSAGLEALADEGILPKRILRLGVPDMFLPHGKPDILRKEIGLDPEHIARSIREHLANAQGLNIRAIG